jgi:hypothetical protein
MKGEKFGGKYAYEICHDVTFYEISFVFDPADPTALVTEILYVPPVEEEPIDVRDTLRNDPLKVLSDPDNEVSVSMLV